MSDTCPFISNSLSIIVIDSPNLTGWLIKMIRAEDIFERIDHCANKAIPTTARTEVIKVKSFVCSTPQTAIITIISVIKMNMLINFNRGQWLAAYNLIVIYFILFDDFGY